MTKTNYVAEYKKLMNSFLVSNSLEERRRLCESLINLAEEQDTFEMISQLLDENESNLKDETEAKNKKMKITFRKKAMGSV